MPKLFHDEFVYPSDENGRYTELTGEVIGVGEPISNDVAVKVQTNLGEFVGYYLAKYAPKIGYFAKIRIYEIGGGHYPDNQIKGWSRDKESL